MQLDVIHLSCRDMSESLRVEVVFTEVFIYKHRGHIYA